VVDVGACASVVDVDDTVLDVESSVAVETEVEEVEEDVAESSSYSGPVSTRISSLTTVVLPWRTVDLVPLEPA
jgi:hypothetical protein